MRYKCLDCGHEFEGSSYTTQCPECGSTKIVPIHSDNIMDKLKKWIKENKLIAGFVVFILILILMGQCSKTPPPPPEQEIYSLEFDQSNNDYCVVYLKDTEGKRVKNNQKYRFLNLTATIDDENGDTYTLNIDVNKIYYCMKGEVTINYKTESSNGLQKLDAKFVGGEKPIPNVNPNNPTNDCRPHIAINNLTYDKINCEIVISIVKGNSHAYVSITGEDGKFKKSNRFDTDGINEKNFHIWYYAKGFEEEKVEYKNEKEKKKILLEIKNKKTSPNGESNNQDIQRQKIEQHIQSILTNLGNKNYDKAEDLCVEAAELYPGLEDKEAIKIDGEYSNIYALRTQVQTLHWNGKNPNFNDAKIDINFSNNICREHIAIIRITIQ